MDPTRAAFRSLIGGSDVRSTRDVGRRARLELRFRASQSRTVLTHAYAEPPLRVGRALPWGNGLHLILASSAPGIFGGDTFEQSIVVERGARVRLSSQSALQVHPAADGSGAVISSRFVVQEGGLLECEWDPLIPFPGARLTQCLEIDLEEGSRLFWSDAMMSGRAARGERWQFASIAHELRVTQAGTLAYLERYRITPDEDALQLPWVAGACCYFGTVLAVDSAEDNIAAELLHSALARVGGVQSAADRLGDSLLLARLMSSSGAPFHEARARVADLWRERRAGT